MEIKSKILLIKPEDHNLFTLSVSKAKTYSDCAKKYKFCYIEKLPRKDRDYHIFGKFLHEILETFYRNILKGNTDPLHINLTKSWKYALSKWKDKLNKEQIAEAKEICQKFLIYLSKNKNAYNVLDVEKNFYINIDEKILLNGFIDRVQRDSDGVLHVSDYKTTKNKKYLKNDFFQLLTYAFVMCLEDPDLQVVRTSYILLRHNFEIIQKDFERKEIMKMEDKFIEYTNKITEDKLFRANPTPLCDWCDYKDNCDEKFMKNRFKEEVVLTKFGKSSW